MYFQYGDKEIEYLRSKDKKLAEVIDKVGHIDRTVDTDSISYISSSFSTPDIIFLHKFCYQRLFLGA